MSTSRRDLWTGTYPTAGAGSPPGTGEGIWRVALDASTGGLGDARQVAVTPAPSFLAAHPSGRVLYAVGEDTAGTVTAFAVGDDGGLTPLATVGSGGADPCHLLLDDDARTLLVANYSSGTLGVLPIDPDGRFAVEVLAAGAPAQVLGHEGTGPRADRQEGPHAHFVALAPGGRHVLVVDLGTDEVRRYTRDPGTGRLTADGIAATLPPGTGPRHLAFAPTGEHAYLTGELDNTVLVLAWDAASATGRLVQTLPATTRGPAPVAAEDLGPTGIPWSPDVPGPDDAGPVLPSHLALTGDRLLVATRTADVLAELTVGPDGLLTPAAEVALPGRWPRHFAVVDGWVVVADQRSHGLSTLRVGATDVTTTLALTSPACVVPVVGLRAEGAEGAEGTAG
ncbi:lactonase family protein [Cellulomonas hominis]